MSEKSSSTYPADEQKPAIFLKGDLKGAMSPEAVADRFRNEWADQREMILSLPTHEEGIRLDRAQNYTKSIGLPEVPCRILSTEDYASVLAIEGAQEANDTHEEARYLPQYNLVVVHRDPIIEELNGPEYLESVVVHEIAHASEEHSSHRVDVRAKKQRWLSRASINLTSPQLLRGGYIVRKGEAIEGYALEEGYAEYERGQYVAEVLGRPYGFADKPDGEGTALDKYMHKAIGADGKIIKASYEGLVAALIIEELSKVDADIIPAFRNGRKDTAGLREVARRIDTIEPGLYQKLRAMSVKTDEDRSELAKLFAHVVGITRQHP